MGRSVAGDSSVVPGEKAGLSVLRFSQRSRRLGWLEVPGGDGVGGLPPVS